MNATKHLIGEKGFRISANLYDAPAAAIILLHGFPDNSHLYDELLPYLTPHYKVITFDFLGWGESDKPLNYPYNFNSLLQNLEDVIRYFKLQKVILVAHDASGPPAIEWALQNKDKVEKLVLLNTFYSRMPIKAPEAIWLFSTPLVRNIARPVAKAFDNYAFKKMYWWQVGRFITKPGMKEKYVPLLYRQFEGTPNTQRAFFSLNRDLLPTMIRMTRKVIKHKTFDLPVQIIFGEKDQYLNSKGAHKFNELFPGSELNLLPNAGHFVQIDEPMEVARLIRRG
jgi:haloalkane dehalogenase